jgi:hypothetical protein
MPGHPDWDASVTWQAPALYFQSSGAIPAAGTVLFSGPLTNYPALLLRGICSAGGYRLRVSWFLDAALTQSLGGDVFDALTGQGFYVAYEVQAPFAQITIDAATAAPAPAGFLAIIPTRATANGTRPLVTPQVIALNNVTIPAGTTNTYTFTFVVLGLYSLTFPAIAPAGSCTFEIDAMNWDGTIGAAIQPATAIPSGGTQSQNMPAQPIQLKIHNTTAGAATLTLVMVSQEQGW